MRSVIEPRDRLIVALDLASVPEAEHLVEALGDTVKFYKVGYQLVLAGGLAFAAGLVGMGKQIFLDLKLHDIANTVARGVENAAQMGVRFLTVHAYPQTMQAAVAARTGDLKILGVTVLTSYNDADLVEAGYACGVDVLARRRAAQSKAIGLDGIVCSPLEAPALREIVGSQMLLVTPGIRLQAASEDDQKRISTPFRAVAAGADYIVVGRPILQAADPKSAAESVIAELESATALMKE
jgi:orotidine-5'-phosphate decarboxylase